jgi:hypothetical protein
MKTELTAYEQEIIDNSRYIAARTNISAAGRITRWGLWENKWNTENGIAPFWNRMKEAEFLSFISSVNGEIYKDSTNAAPELKLVDWRPIRALIRDSRKAQT